MWRSTAGAPSTVFTLDLGQVGASIGNVWNAEVFGPPNGTAYTLQLASYYTSNFGFNGAVAGGGHFVSTPRFACADEQFRRLHCPHLLWHVWNVWPGGAHVQADVTPWREGGVLQLELPADSYVRDLWNAYDYGTGHDLLPGGNRTTLKLASYHTTNLGFILESTTPGSWLDAATIDAGSFCGNWTRGHTPSWLHGDGDGGSTMVTVGLLLEGGAALGPTALQQLAIDVAAALEADDGEVEALSEYVEAAGEAAAAQRRQRKRRRRTDEELGAEEAQLSIVLSLGDSALVTPLAAQLHDGESALRRTADEGVRERLTTKLRVAQYTDGALQWVLAEGAGDGGGLSGGEVVAVVLGVLFAFGLGVAVAVLLRRRQQASAATLASSIVAVPSGGAKVEPPVPSVPQRQQEPTGSTQPMTSPSIVDVDLVSLPPR